MSLTFSIIITKNGVPQDADATPMLSDPTNAFGIRRTDTGDIVVAAGTAMTRNSAGNYQYTLTGEVDDVTYEAWPRYTLNGVTFNEADTKTAGSTTNRPVSWDAAKAHLRLDTDDDQDYVESLIDAATDYAESRCATTLVGRTITAVLSRDHEIFYGPVVSIGSVTDAQNQTITNYNVETIGFGTSLCIRQSYKPPITVVYHAGYDDVTKIPASICQAILMHVATLYQNRESVTDRAMIPVPHSLDAFYGLKSRNAGIA